MKIPLLAITLAATAMAGFAHHRLAGVAAASNLQVELAALVSAGAVAVVAAGAWLLVGRERRAHDRAAAGLQLRTSALHSTLGDTQRALEYARAACLSARRSSRPETVAAAEECLGDALCSAGQSADGAEHWRVAFQIMHTRRRPRHAARLCRKLADLHVDLGNGTDAVRWQRRAAEHESLALQAGGADGRDSAGPSTDAGGERGPSAEAAFHTAKMAAVGRMVAGVNHELKQPLVSMRLLAASSLERLERRELLHVQRNLRDLLAMVDQIARLTTALDHFSRKQPCRPAPTRLSACIGDALRVLEPQLRAREHDIRVHGSDPEVWLDHDRVRLILVNLLSNAIDATADAADRHIEIDIRAEGALVVLRVRDFGPGFPPEVQQHLFDMFVTTKAEGRGLGLGLALCAKMAREMGGTLAGRNHPQGGAEFTLSLPPGTS